MPTPNIGWTYADLQRIDDAIASGTKIVKYQDREVEYPSITELLAAKAAIEQALAVQNGTTQIRMVQMYTKSGW